MRKISIVTDSDASLPDDLAQAHHIYQVPISIHFGDEVFESGINIDDESLFERVNRENVLPTTAAPTPGKFEQIFEQAFANDGSEALVCLCVSGEISTTHNSAKLAAEDLPHRKIIVMDTRSLSFGQGFMALAASKAIDNGASLDEVIRSAESIGSRVHLFGALSTLKYLSMSGRVSHLAAGMAGMLDIKPILSIQNGKLEMIEKVRTRKKSLERIIELAKKESAHSQIEQMAVVHVSALHEAQAFKTMLSTTLDFTGEIIMAALTPGLSVHTGSGMLAVGFVTDD